MSGGRDDDAEKSHEPTRHKLDEARKKGELARSADLTTAAPYGGVLLAGLAAGPQSIDQISTTLMVLIGQADRIAPLIFEGRSSATVGGLMASVGLGLIAWFVIPAGMALLSVIAQRSFVVAPEKLHFKLSRINPIANAKNKYGASGLFEFVKSFAKLVCYSVLLGVFVAARLDEMAGSLHGEPHGIGMMMVRLMLEFMMVVFVIALAIGAIDLMWQRFDHLRKNRMSYQEVKDEHKQNEGDPHMKQERRQRAMQIASDQMMADVPTADVIIVNPTHYAVALKWSRQAGSAPECVAKGVDHVALRMRELASRHGIPIRNDPPTARALYATTDIGREIAPDHFRAVAAAIRFADAMRRRARHFE